MSDVYYDSGLKGWIRKTAAESLWRFNGRFDLEDLMQDGYECYLRCRNRYTNPIPDSPGHQNLFTNRPTEAQRKHFMSLVQRSFINHLNTLATAVMKTPEDPISNLSRADGEPLTMDDILPPQEEEVTVRFTLSQAPTEIADAIGKLIQDGVDGGKYLRSRLRRSGDRLRRGRSAIRETTLDRQIRVVGSAELLEETTEYLLA